MPKQIYKIDQFHGGLNSGADPRDIADNELSVATDVDVSNLGKIVMAGGMSVKNYETEPTGLSYETPGADLRFFKHDYSGLHDGSGTTGVATSTQYLSLAHNDTGPIVIYENDGTSEDWSQTNTYSLTNGARNSVATYLVGGALRIGDGDLGGNNAMETVWVGYVNKDKFIMSGDSTEYYTDNQWYVDFAEPLRAVGEISAGWGVSTAANFPTGKNKVNIHLMTDDTYYKGVGFADGTNPTHWAVATSFVLDGNQESRLYEISSDSTPLATTFTNDSALHVRAFIRATDSAGSDHWNPRITGINLYLKEVDVDEEWYLAVQYDTTNGGKVVSDDSYSWWAQNAGGIGDKYVYSEQVLTVPQKFLTYQVSSGRKFQANNIRVKFKAGIVANRRSYIGGVSYIDNNNNLVVRSDSILYSEVDQFDIFSAENILEVNSNDGDEIITIIEYADRILEFKRNNLSVINISQETPFIEDSYRFNGIENRASAFKTDHGIAWANTSGLWLYDGKSISNQLEKNGGRLIALSDWQSFLGTDPGVFYSPKDRIVGVLDSVNSDSSGNAYLFDLVTQSLTYAPSTTPGNIISSFAINEDNNPIYYDYTTGSFNVWTSGPTASSLLNITTKDIDFGSPGIRKKIYKVYITYKLSSGTIAVKYATDGGSIVNPGISLVSSADWNTIEASISVSNCYSFQLELSSLSSPEDFEINDISIVYRTKSIR